MWHHFSAGAEGDHFTSNNRGLVVGNLWFVRPAGGGGGGGGNANRLTPLVINFPQQGSLVFQVKWNHSMVYQQLRATRGVKGHHTAIYSLH